MELHTEILAVVKAFEDEGIDYALCGGIALAIHGFPRFTKDVDFLVHPTDIDRMLAVLRPLGFIFKAIPLRFGANTANVREIHRISKVEGEDTLTLDFILLSPLFDDAWRGREAVAWKARTLRVVSRDGLVTMKRLAGRPQDLADIAVLTASSSLEDGANA